MDTTRILIIDDEPDFTALLKANLEEVGNFEVMEVNDSSRALKAAKEFQPELCVIDVVMPGLDGGDVVAQFRADPELKDLAVVMLTALVEENPDTPDGETQTGGLPFVSKTSEFGTILSCIEKHIEESRDRSAAGSTSGSSEVWDIG
ncbi:response regulator [Luteolibacter sp. GHJ8]|uniref:Response regulator n=1 Tax=Luteolibacter rhizosphaerae TaxID=2989719 RepID=A0ABT3GAN7_9BACT|nr:response regulator [Luteolibacter rhizosphaerae]MCW1916909.1 response regulator [Luteolibacter rhizosphaerae]